MPSSIDRGTAGAVLFGLALMVACAHTDVPPIAPAEAETTIEGARESSTNRVPTSSPTVDSGAARASSTPSALASWEDPDAGVASGDASAGAPVANAVAVVNGLSGEMARCYKQALPRRMQEGRLSVTIIAGPLCDVKHVQATNRGDLDEEMVGCVVKVAYGAQFGPDPARGTATISTSFSFVRK